MAKKLSLNKLNAELEKNPENAELLRQRAWLYISFGGKKNYELAEKDIMNSLRIEPESTYGLRSATYCQCLLGKPKLGLKYAQQACSLEPDNSKNYYFRGLCYKDLGKYSKAVSDFSSVSLSDVNYYYALKNRTKCYLNLKNYEKALWDIYTLVLAREEELTSTIHGYDDHLHDLYQKYPNNAIYNFLKGWLTRDNPKTAIGYYSVAIENNPPIALFYFFRGKEYSKVSLNAEAIADFSKAIELDPLNTFFYALRADAYIKLNDFQSAFNDLAEAIKIKPSAYLHFKYAETCMSAFSLDQEETALISKAESYYLKAIKISPESVKYKIRLAELYQKAGKHDDAVKYLLKAQKAIHNIPGDIDPDDHYELMKSLLHYFPKSEYYLREIADWEDLNEDLEKSVENYTALIQLNPKEPDYFTKRAAKYFEMHLYENAIEDLEIAKSLGRDESLFIAMCFMKMGAYRKALQILEEKEMENKHQLCLDKSYCYFMLNDEKSSLSELQDIDPARYLFETKKDFTLFLGEPFHFLQPSFYGYELRGPLGNVNAFLSLVMPQCSHYYFMTAIRHFFLLDKLNCPTHGLVSDAVIFDKWENQPNLNMQSSDLEPYSNLYPEFEESWKFILARDGNVLFNLRLKLVFIERLESILKRPASHAQQHQDHINKIVEAIHDIKENLYNPVNIELAKKHEKEIADARVHERNKIIADLSHSIKNMISTIIDPLENLKNEKTLQPQVLENALRGANLIREIVNAMNLSFKGSIEDFTYDAQHANGSTAVSLQEMLRQSVVYSITNMFDGKYFNIFMRQYFNDKDLFISAKAAWENVSHSADLQQFIPFLKEYFFTCEVNIDLSGELAIGNDKGSAIKLLILFQEIVLNAVKYCSFTPKSQRFIKIDLQESADNIVFMVENSYQKNIAAKTTGIGHILIDNFASLLNATSKVVKNEEKYKVEISFPNIWKERL